MSEAANEMQLLKEAEAHLGAAVWPKLDQVEELSIEYWKLRKLTKEREKIATELEKCQEELTEAHAERASLLGSTAEPFQDLLDERREIIAALEDLARERDELVAKAREVKRAYDGLKLKQEVLRREAVIPDDLERTAAKLSALKTEFTGMKQQRQLLAEKITAKENLIDDIEARIDKRKAARRIDASLSSQKVGDANQRMSPYRAELGLLDTQMHQLYSEVGRFVSRHSQVHPGCRDAVKSHKGLVEVMAALRESIALNHKLAEIS
ncbi:hypothetical protein [Luteolibacter algae]